MQVFSALICSLIFLGAVKTCVEFATVQIGGCIALILGWLWQHAHKCTHPAPSFMLFHCTSKSYPHATSEVYCCCIFNYTIKFVYRWFWTWLRSANKNTEFKPTHPTLLWLADLSNALMWLLEELKKLHNLKSVFTFERLRAKPPLDSGGWCTFKQHKTGRE